MAEQHVHFVGIGGIHMSGLAGILLSDGQTVSGSDLTRSPLTDDLAARGARIAIGHDATNVAGADLVVRTVAVPDDNPELVAARAAGVEIISRAQMVARIAAGRRTLTVAGSHGKTTTSTMVTLILREAGLNPSYILGGESPELAEHAARGSGSLIVLEADEYGRAFHEYRPAVAAILNLEADHLDYYGTEEALRQAFLDYARTLEPGGRLIVGGESRCALSVADTLRRERDDLTLESFGIGEPSQWSWTASALQPLDDGMRFTLHRAGQELGAVRLRVPGELNVRNAVAAAAIAMPEGASLVHLGQALGAFGGVQRRFQVIGEAAGVLVVDDYAHHPSEIEATLSAARRRYPQRRLVVLFQPHTYSRSQYLLAGFQTCFAGVDQLYLTETYAARETPDQGLAAVDLADQIDSPRPSYLGPLSDAVTALTAAARPGDLVLTMGAGDVGAAGPALLEQLREGASR